MKLRTALFLLCIVQLTGCAMTRTINDIGKEGAELGPGRFQVLDDGAMLLETKLQLLNRWAYTTIRSERYRRYVVVPAALVTKDIEAALASGRLVANAVVEVVSEDREGAHFYPPDVLRRDASLDDLPELIRSQVRDNAWVTSLGVLYREGVAGTVPKDRGDREPVSAERPSRARPYEVYAVTLPDGVREVTYFWHYPAQILVVPALVIDFITFPIQYSMYRHRLN